MTPEHLARIRAIFEGALDREASERAAFLDRECQGDETIRNEVEGLLAARERVPDWLNEPLLARAPILDSPAGSLPRMEGRDLSGYTLIREIGRGGMGSVYLAERSDGAFRKQVASNWSSQASTALMFWRVSSKSGRFWLRSIIPASPGFWTLPLPRRVSPTS
jgi:hypothetical protein